MFGKIAVLEFVLMLVMAAAGVEYFKYSQDQIATLHENNAKLETAVNTQQETIKAQQQASAAQAAQMITLQQHIADAETARRAFEDKLRQKDISAMARSNAADLEAKMNRATIQVLQDIINLTTPKDRQITPQQLQEVVTPPQINIKSKPPAISDTKPAISPDTQVQMVPANNPTTVSSSSNVQPAPRPPKNYSQSGQN